MQTKSKAEKAALLPLGEAREVERGEEGVHLLQVGVEPLGHQRVRPRARRPLHVLLLVVGGEDDDHAVKLVVLPQLPAQLAPQQQRVAGQLEVLVEDNDHKRVAGQLEVLVEDNDHALVPHALGERRHSARDLQQRVVLLAQDERA
eukprot:CAMPEP_0113258100 /NCGR_PEP_ID=MMETSP0008_2-20120614/15644_1 /TAXON_ID=97485 /ORGANISM="Prymnesium parvum" /LENGTH=145 /DNA_ID=CAMNT_0000106541 /DNA_START=233 /DNA_END=667 /DNA_ORIENTATION=+ /assembly_acc=CAM_ASM_000153